MTDNSTPKQKKPKTLTVEVAATRWVALAQYIEDNEGQRIASRLEEDYNEMIEESCDEMRYTLNSMMVSTIKVRKLEHLYTSTRTPRTKSPQRIAYDNMVNERVSSIVNLINETDDQFIPSLATPRKVEGNINTHTTQSFMDLLTDYYVKANPFNAKVEPEVATE